VTALADRIHDALAAPLTVDDTELAVTASIGVAVAPPGTDSRAEDLLHRADVAMYRAKRAGRGAVEIDRGTT
jgi:diguanylate cyclase (GGDEF)-like protein